ncbi:PREDICTED: uncharacterized protein LOC108764039 [Trachymyrmex cornetzi]|uniref:uncharacterized protein LOC108764039 n=1 Tax=Trachymyrmex cornetzi TaxID=471704 RepID=UPI00084F7C73|nr:PREDICTED: uncharacterized protein LOC108764039 [Trachymyrmex cornetzi]
MEKVSLYDHTSDKMCDVMLSPDDARRAVSDITFATSVLNIAILQQNQENNMQTAANEIATTAVDNDSSIDKCEERSLYRWTDSCVIFLLQTESHILHQNYNYFHWKNNSSISVQQIQL